MDEKYLPGYWSVPAGYVEPEEDIKACAVRETQEETGILVPENETKFLSAYPSSDGEGCFMIICIIVQPRLNQSLTKNIPSGDTLELMKFPHR